MKLRFGFVTNSSSSSFLVSFDTVPQTIDELRKLMFGDRTHFPSAFGNEVYTTLEIAEVVFRDMQKNGPVTDEIIDNIYRYGYCEEIDGQLNDEDFRSDEDGIIDWDRYSHARENLIEAAIESFKESVGGKTVYAFTYADDSGEFYCTLEHGGIFRQLQHTVISNH